MVIIDTIDYETKIEAHKKENEFMIDLNASLNSCKAPIYVDQKEYTRQHYIDNKEKIKERKKQYRENNKDKINEYMRQYRAKKKN